MKLSSFETALTSDKGTEVICYGMQQTQRARGNEVRQHLLPEGKLREMTGAENSPHSNFRRLVLGCIEAKFGK